MDPEVVSDIMKDISYQYGYPPPLKITPGKIYDYLGMKIDFSFPGKEKFAIVDYIGKMLDDLPENLKE